MRLLLISLNANSWYGLSRRQDIVKRQLKMADIHYDIYEMPVTDWRVEVDRDRFCRPMMEEYAHELSGVGALKHYAGAETILIDLGRPGSIYPQGGMELAWVLSDTFMNVSVLTAEMDVPLLRDVLPNAYVYATLGHFITDQRPPA